MSNQLSRAMVTLLSFLGLLIGRASGTSLCLPPSCFRGYVISLAPTALTETLDWRVSGEFGPSGPHPHLSREIPGRPEEEREAQKGFPTCPALRRELRWGSSKRCLTGPLQYEVRMASGGRGSERLPCSPRSREGRGKAGVLLRQGGAQAGSEPCRTIAKSAQTPLCF